MPQATMDFNRKDPVEGIRWSAMAGGGLIALTGLRHGGTSGLLLVLGGTALALAGASGRALSARRVAEEGILVEKAATINAAPERVYGLWRDLENLPSFMDHLESVKATGERRSHWVAKAPAGMKVEWDAETTEDTPNRRLAWRAVEGSQVPNEGSVEFRPAPGDRGTEVLVRLSYRPPAGAIGAAVARLFGEEPGQQVEDDLRRLKRRLELGSTPTVEGQSSGRKTAVGRALAGVYDNRRTS